MVKNIDYYSDNALILFKDKPETIITKDMYFYIPDSNGEFKSIFNDKLKKIYYNRKSKTNIKFNNPIRFESDVNNLQKYLIDNFDVPFPKYEFHKCYIDIETDWSIDIINTPKPIISITIYSNKTKEYYIWVWKENLTVTYENNVYYHNNEKDMLDDFFEFVKVLDADVYLGWNTDEFDFPYIINRCKLLNITSYNKLSKLNEVSISKENRVRIKGNILFDLLKVWKKLSPNKLESNSLKNVAKKILNDEKLEVNTKKIWNDIPLLLQYNKQDVKLIVDIDDQEMLFDFYDERRREFGVHWDNLFYSSGINDCVALRYAKKLGIVLPDVKENDRGKVEGSICLKATPGIYKNVICLDMTALYPSLIMQFNMSIETVRKNGYTLPNGVTFDKDNEGFTVKILKDYISLRNKYKKEMFKYTKGSKEYQTYFLKQYNYKIQTNSFFGYLGYEGSRLFDKDVFRSVTYMGRLAVTYCKEVIERLGYNIIYQDTDSSYFGIDKDLSKEELLVIANNVVNEINISFDNWVKEFGCTENKYLNIKLEQINDVMFFGSADTQFVKGKIMKVGKRYAYHCIWKDNHNVDYVGYVGFETIRSDACKITQLIQDKIFHMILLEKSNKEQIDEYIKIEKEKLMISDFNDWDLIGIPKSINNDFDEYKNKSAHIVSSEWSNKHLSLDIKQGDRIKYIYGSIKGLPETKYFAFHNAEDLKGKDVIVNWDKMIEVMIDNKIARIYSALEWKYFKETELEKELNKQTKLDRW